jgi:WD40 repeat protein
MRDMISTENAVKLAQLTQVQCGWITQVSWSPDGSVLAVAGAAGVRLYVRTFGSTPTHLLEGHSGHIKGMAFSPDGALLITVAADLTIKLWDMSRLPDRVHEIATLRGHDDSIDGVAFHPDGQTFATCGADGDIILWDVVGLFPREVLRGHESEVSSLAFGLDGNVLFSAGRDYTVRLWDTGAETYGTIFGQHGDWVRQVRTNPPGTMLASASKDMSVRLWDAHTGDQYAVLYAHWQGVDAVAFSPNSALLASSGRDNVIRIWSIQQALHQRELTREAALITLAGHDKPVLSLAFNPAGTLLASGSGDNTVRLWSVDPAEDGGGQRQGSGAAPRSGSTSRLGQD